MVVLNFDELFKISMAALKFNGAHPAIPKDMRWLFKFSIMQGLFFLTAFFMSYSAIFVDLKVDIVLACTNISLVVVIMYNTFTYFMILAHKEDYLILFKTMKHDYEMAYTLPKEERELVESFAKKGSFVCKSWLLIVICFFNVFISKPFVTMMYLKSVDRFRYVQALDLTYPPGMEENKDCIYVFSFVFFLMAYADVYSSSLYVGFVPMGPASMLHACGQLEVLKLRVMQLFPQDGTIIESEDRKQRLNAIAKRLQDIYDFVDHTKAAFKVMYEITLKGSALILPVVAYQIVDALGKGDMSLEFTFGLFCGGIALSAYPCYYGDILIETGNSFRTTVYMSRWETHFDKTIRSTLLMIMTRTERSVAIRSMFRVVCLDALADVYHQAYALFSVINAAWG